MAGQRVRVLVADDHPVFRFGLRALLHASPDVELVGEAGSGEEAVALATAVRPDVVLMDLTMPGGNGIEATRTIVASCPETGVLVLTMIEEEEALVAAMRAGARGYILKGADGAETLRAIAAVANGESIFGPAVARRLIDRITSAPAAGQPPFSDLTARERDVLTLIGEGYTNAAIADRLFLSPKTVRNHVSNVFAKLGASDRAQAIIRAREAGLTQRR